MELLQPGTGAIPGRHYLPSTVATVSWGWLPGEGTPAALSVDSGDTVTVDTVSHEGILEDQGRDPVAFFGRHGVGPDQVLDDARAIASEHPARDADSDGPHVVTGPVRVRGAGAGDVLRVEVLQLQPRAPYGVISSRHGLGALPGELPDPDGPGVVSLFCRTLCSSGVPMAVLALARGAEVRFPLAPFLGLMGVTPAGPPRNSVPPGEFGGNIDVNLLGVGSTLYLPVQVDGAGFYAGDPHFAQGDGEIALTALEAPLRATVRLTTVSGPAAATLRSRLGEPVAETASHWLLLGLHVDLNEALRRAARNAVAFLVGTQGLTAAEAYAYLSAAADFEVSQVVDQVSGVHCLIRKSDFPPW